MTTNELKCPVCGERMKIGFYADNMECTGCELELPRTVMKAIQSRIDKEKAAAVQEERERVDCKTCSHERGCSSQISIMTVSGRVPIDISGCSAHELKFALKKKLISKMK